MDTVNAAKLAQSTCLKRRISQRALELTQPAALPPLHLSTGLVQPTPTAPLGSTTLYSTKTALAAAAAPRIAVAAFVALCTCLWILL